MQQKIREGMEALVAQGSIQRQRDRHAAGRSRKELNRAWRCGDGLDMAAGAAKTLEYRLPSARITGLLERRRRRERAHKIGKPVHIGMAIIVGCVFRLIVD